MAFFAALSVLQMTTLPGIVAVAAIRYRATLVNIAVAVFALSFALNYGIVSLLIACGVYSRGALLGVIAGEVVALFLLRGRARIDSRPAERSTAQPLLFAALAAAVVSLAWAVALWSRSLGLPFIAWDAVKSWNRWALVFAGGAFPPDVQYYPQLIPSNWSMTYVLTNSTATEAFARAPMGLFFILTLLAITSAGLAARNPGIILGAAVTALLERKCVGEYLTDGYVDVAVAFFAIASVLLLPAESADERRTSGDATRTLWVSCAIAAAAALTKQAGLFVFFVWPVLAIARCRVNARAVLAPWVTLALAPAAFYLAQYLAILRGRNYSNIAYVTHDIYRGAAIPQRALLAFRSLGIYATVFAFVIVMLPLLPRFARWLALAVGVPFTVLWACYFSYDRRNLALALPFIGIAAAAGALELLQRAMRLAVQRRS